MDKKTLLSFIDAACMLSVGFFGACTFANMIYQNNMYIFTLFAASGFVALSFSLIFTIIRKHTVDKDSTF
jgi:hypothetical protein